MSDKSSRSRTKITTIAFQLKKTRGHPITMLTAYDYATALAIERSGIDAILVGDSLGMVVLGYENTLPVTMDDMLHHCKAVARGANSPLLIGDMPFMSYQTGRNDAVRNAGRFLAEGGMDCVKLEGGSEVSATAQAIIRAGIPVMGHLGLTPQSVRKLGGFKSQARNSSAALKLLENALILEDSWCFSVVLEAIPDRVADLVSERLSIPTIGIGAGPSCDGQVLVTQDLLGILGDIKPRFVKQYAHLDIAIAEALASYKAEVENLQFPSKEHTFSISEDEWDALLNLVDDPSRTG